MADARSASTPGRSPPYPNPPPRRRPPSRADRPRRAELEISLDWFDRVWKRPPNEIEAELGKPEPDRGRIEELGRAMAAALDLFEALLGGRDYLFGELSAADFAAFPFLKYALFWPDGDRELFHEILRDSQPLGPSHPQLEAWIRRIDALPRA